MTMATATATTTTKRTTMAILMNILITLASSWNETCPISLEETGTSEPSRSGSVGDPVGSGKTALTLALCERLRDRINLGVLTNDIFIPEDRDFLHSKNALPNPAQVVAIETGGCPHAAIREDVSANMAALEKLQREFSTELLIVESGGDNLAANYSRELADYIIYVIDVAGGDKIPRKGGPGISQSDLLVVNKIDLAPYVGASLEVMRRDSDLMRDGGATVFTSVKHGEGVDAVVGLILAAWEASGAMTKKA
ncbi:hypothetical protein CROQUDRAFT_661593 [Cronartium quercuum f. sp. fusiforme G11]|uniref:CobW/HypB/UreG nucleotide-binding domain-containing protein n=1 Tax=Cronartium quercuum f. sp. fusiforme G11 TaxID=708437 RepID=A0A9P6NAW3_9BASI|nr:hypothetical protein CROQUDRAFT_661593 [Cronartium quercuum f. sp. fusiforme G11]